MNIRGFHVNRKLGAIEVNSGGIVALSHTEVEQVIRYLTEQLPLIVEASKEKQRNEIAGLLSERNSIDAQIALLRDKLGENTDASQAATSVPSR